MYAFTALVLFCHVGVCIHSTYVFSNGMRRCMHLQYFVVVGGTLLYIKRNYYDPCVTAYFQCAELHSIVIL